MVRKNQAANLIFFLLMMIIQQAVFLLRTICHLRIDIYRYACISIRLLQPVNELPAGFNLIPLAEPLGIIVHACVQHSFVCFRCIAAEDIHAALAVFQFNLMQGIRIAWFLDIELDLNLFAWLNADNQSVSRHAWC